MSGNCLTKTYLMLTGFLLIYPLNATTCLSPDDYHQNDFITALTWSSVGRPCSTEGNPNLTNQTTEFLLELQEKEQDIYSNTRMKTLSRKRRFYLTKDPTMTCELRYVLPLFAISTELGSFATIELPCGADLSYPIMENNAKEEARDGEASYIMEGLENIISKIGVDGRACVLRSICDVASITPVKPQGIIRDAMEVAIKHMLKEAKDSTSKPGDSSPKSNISYLEAAAAGKAGVDCSQEFRNCPLSFLNLINLPEINELNK